jgi:hypothetical protein
MADPLFTVLQSYSQTVINPLSSSITTLAALPSAMEPAPTSTFGPSLVVCPIQESLPLQLSMSSTQMSLMAPSTQFSPKTQKRMDLQMMAQQAIKTLPPIRISRVTRRFGHEEIEVRNDFKALVLLYIPVMYIQSSLPPFCLL